jgi:hypothetical protein
MSKADKIKAIVKGPAPKETFGTNPCDPWSTKAGISEWAGNPAGLLAKYLKSRGINPKFASKDQKIAHSKTGQFSKWQKDHAERSSPTGTSIRGESVDMCKVCGQTPCNCTSIEEGVDKKDTVTFDIPLLIRVLELAREDIKSDMDLHRVVERLINMRDKGMLTMDDYDAIAAIKEEVYSSVSLEHIKQALSEAKEANYGGDYQDSVLALKKKAEQKKVDMKSLADRMQAAYRRDNQTKGVKSVAEGNGYDDNRTGFAKKPREDDEGHAPTKFKAKSIMDRPHTVHIDGKPWKKFSNGHQAHAAVNTLSAKGKKATAIAHFKEDTYQDPQAATQTVFDGGNNPNDITPPEYKGKRLIQMSKSARIIKNLYKMKGMKEETYDFEKADKSVASYGKPPKISKTDKAITDGDKEQAAIVLSGGKTLTGDDRDTVEIDPKMKMRPNQPEPTKNGKPQVK